MNNEVKVVEHIKLIQPVISRMSSSSFTIKVFALTIQALLIGFALKDAIWQLNLALFMITFILCLLDMFYLWQERLYRKLYDEVRIAENTDFSMSTHNERKEIKYCGTLNSIAIWPFYTALLLINGTATVLEVLKCGN